MRIGISTSVIQRGKTGVAQYVFGLVRALKPLAAEHEFTLFTLEEDLSSFDFVKGAMRTFSVSEGFRPAVKNIIWHQSALPRLAQDLSLDVLHIPSYRRMLWRSPCPRVATIHDLAAFHIANKYDWKRMFYGRVVARRLAHRQNQIIAISENTAQDLVRYFKIDRSRISMVHNGLDHGRFFPGSREGAKANAAAGYGLHTPFFLYVARIEHPAKNHVPLIEAFERFKAATRSDWQLALAGSDWHGAEVVHAAIKKSVVAADIKTLGFVPDERLPELYRAAEAFVYPSLYEGFGFPPVEAMACGCPVICSTRGSLGEVVGQAAAIVDPASVESMASQLSALATDSATRAKFRAAGLLQSKKFDWSRTAAETMKVYEQSMLR